MKNVQWFWAGMIFTMILVCVSAMTHTDAVYTWGDGSYFSGTSSRRVPCELCGEALSVSVPGENSMIFLNATASLPLAEYESSYCVDAWEFSLSHDLCDECSLLSNEKLKKPLVAKHDEIWKSLIELRADEKAEREVKRKGFHVRNLKGKIANLQEELKEIEGKQE